MKRNVSTNHPKPAAHLRMIDEAIASGFIRRVGDLYEITDAGHEHTRALTAAYPNSSTFEGNDD